MCCKNLIGCESITIIIKMFQNEFEICFYVSYFKFLYTITCRLSRRTGLGTAGPGRKPRQRRRLKNVFCHCKRTGFLFILLLLLLGMQLMPSREAIKLTLHWQAPSMQEESGCTHCSPTTHESPIW